MSNSDDQFSLKQVVEAELAAKTKERIDEQAAEQLAAKQAAAVADIAKREKNLAQAERLSKIQAVQPRIKVLRLETVAMLISHMIPADYQLSRKYQFPRMYGWPLYYTWQAGYRREKIAYGDEGTSPPVYHEEHIVTYLGPDAKLYTERDGKRASRVTPGIAIPLESWRALLEKFLVESIEANRAVTYRITSRDNLHPDDSIHF